MNLAENWSEGGWMEEGDHVVKVKDFRMYKAHSGNVGVEFEVVDAQKRTCKTDGFYMTPKALWKLSSFVSACGLEKEQCRDYNPEQPTSHNRLKGRKLMATVTKEPGGDGKEYSRVTAWRRIEVETHASEPTPQPYDPSYDPADTQQRPQTSAVPPLPPLAAPIPEDDIPF